MNPQGIQQPNFAVPPGANYQQQQQTYLSQTNMGVSDGSGMFPPSRHQNETGEQQTSPQAVLPQSDNSIGPSEQLPLVPQPQRQSSFTNNDTSVLIANPALDEETDDGRINNREAAEKIKDAYIYKQIQNRQDEFTQYKQARLFLGTWNVNAKGKEESLEDWLTSDWGSNGEHAPDIVCVGFQEIVDLNAVNVAIEGKSQQRSQFWLDRIRSTLNDRDLTKGDPMRCYTYIAHKSLVGLLICVFVKNPHHARVKYVHVDSVGVGVMGVMGNKGGVSVRLQFYDSTICCVCTHLAAHRENVIGRNADFESVFKKTSFDIGDEAVKEVINGGSLKQWANGTSTVEINDHDLVFWIGDLNYRVDDSLGTEQVLDMAKKGILDELLQHDQLNIERAAGRVFQGFQEGKITFKPTYKYQPNTDLYEERQDKKLRAPAWCDRILWMAQTPAHVSQLNYLRSEINISDHKPVMSTFAITIKVVIQNKREEVYEEIMKRLDKFDNNHLPMVGLDRISLDFGHVRYDQTVTLPIKISNTGKVYAQFHLVPKLEEASLCKPWMSVSPSYGMLIPGEKDTTIHFSITIDNETARALNAGQEVLDDILILRLEKGRDYYITVTAQYARSCFGMSIDELVMYAEPIRTIPLDPIQKAEKLDLNPSAALCVPKEFWRIVDAIYERGLQEKDLFTTPGIASEVYEIRECLDTGCPFGEFLIHSMTEVMLSFLSNLSSPIVPTNLFPTLEVDAQNIQSFSRKFLEELPPIHYNVFVYIISFFRECLLHAEHNKLSATKLARICSNCLVMGSGQPESDAQRRVGMQMIMQHFLSTTSI